MIKWIHNIKSDQVCFLLAWHLANQYQKRDHCLQRHPCTPRISISSTGITASATTQGSVSVVLLSVVALYDHCLYLCCYAFLCAEFCVVLAFSVAASLSVRFPSDWLGYLSYSFGVSLSSACNNIPFEIKPI